MTDSIDALKRYALVTDLHLEAYLPLQTASIAFDVVRGVSQKEKAYTKFKKYFSTKVLKPLEKNLLNVCNPDIQYTE